MLAIRNPAAAERFHALYADNGDPSVPNQLRTMNHWLCYQLATLPHCTMQWRTALMYETEFDSWVAMVSNLIIPHLVAHNLPVDLTMQTHACTLTI